MNKIKGSMTITLTAEEVVGINALLEKDMPKPLVEHEFSDGTTGLQCPVCGRFVTIVKGNEYHYCPGCGQHLDTENIAL